MRATWNSDRGVWETPDESLLCGHAVPYRAEWPTAGIALAGTARPLPGPEPAPHPLLLPTPNPFHMGNTEEPEVWRRRRLDVFQRTGTRHGPALSVVALSIAYGDPLTPDRYMPDDAAKAAPALAAGLWEDDDDA